MYLKSMMPPTERDDAVVPAQVDAKPNGLDDCRKLR